MAGGAAAVLVGVALLVTGALGPLPMQAESPRRAEIPASLTGDALLGVVASSGGLDATISALQERLSGSDGDWRSYATLGLAYLQKARMTSDPAYYRRAGAALRRSLELDDEDNYHAKVGLGMLAAARHDFSAALAWGQRARAANPYGSQALGVIGDALVELGRYRRAGRVLQQMVDLRPDLASYSRASHFQELHGRTTAAIESMSDALGFASGSGEDAAWAAFQLGELYFSTGAVDTANREYTRGTVLAPDYALPQAGLAKVAAARGDWGRAAELLDEVVERYPAPEFVILLGDVYAASGRSSLAADHYELVGTMQQLYEANGVNMDVEIALFQVDHRIGVEDALKRAKAEWRKRHSVHVADVLSWTLYANEKYRRAKLYSSKALRLGMPSALFHFHAGMIAFKLGERDAARTHLSRALDLNPNFSFIHGATARDALDRL